MIAHCGKCQRTFPPLFKDNSNTIVVCPHCQTIYERKNSHWICEYHMVLNPNPIEIPLNEIVIYSRECYKNVSLKLLEENIKKEGILYPIFVRKEGPKRYALVDGFQRCLAAEALGWKSIPCLIIQDEDYASQMSQL